MYQTPTPKPPANAGGSDSPGQLRPLRKTLRSLRETEVAEKVAKVNQKGGAK
ncbi:MAG: hypothetical protein KA746_14750 [Pyrinomonadaceae bacterium]|nr:hypothetical protein [Pyrinomonadaceae bacterium]